MTTRVCAVAACSALVAPVPQDTGPPTAPTASTGVTAPEGVAVATAPGEISPTWTPPRAGAPVTHHELHLNGRFATTVVWGADPPTGRAGHGFAVQAPRAPATS
ncbi:hypothetical protein ACFW2Y_14200 [Streptomyces sp. NPDC058877]|uniref:hypothetical protein n=1 Tax=unclassified Streptomyces TaxID=2593676 RepID=UPI0036CA73E6